MSVEEKVAVLLSSVDGLVKSVDRFDKKMDTVHERIIINSESTKTAHKRIDDIVPKVEEHAAAKNRAIGMAAGVSAIFGSIGIAAQKFLGGW